MATVRPVGMTHGAKARLFIAAVLLFVAFWLIEHRHHRIDQAEAEARAGMMLTAYVRETRQPAAHFAKRRIFVGSDGWDFIWTYRPCAEVGELRISVDRSGAMNYATLPDCFPANGFAVGPRRA